MKNTFLVAVLLAAATTTASAGGKSGTIGVGVERQINVEAGGLSANYDAGKFHVGGFFSFHDRDGDNNHTYSFGGRFFYHVHETLMSDLGLGIGLGLVNVPDPTPMNMDNRSTHMYIEPSAQIRLFLAQNVALSFTAGLVIGTIDADGIALDGQGIGIPDSGFGIGLPTALAGVHYYFF